MIDASTSCLTTAGALPLDSPYATLWTKRPGSDHRDDYGAGTDALACTQVATGRRLIAALVQRARIKTLEAALKGNNARPTVAIIGAGIGGVYLVAMLGLIGCKVRLHDRGWCAALVPGLRCIL